MSKPQTAVHPVRPVHQAALDPQNFQTLVSETMNHSNSNIRTFSLAPHAHHRQKTSNILTLLLRDRLSFRVEDKHDCFSLHFKFGVFFGVGKGLTASPLNPLLARRC